MYHSLGLPGLLGVGVFVAAALAHLVVRPDWTRDAASKTGSIASLQRDLARATAARRDDPLPEAARERLRGLPAASSLAELDAIDRLHAAASAAALQLEVGSYRFAGAPGDPLARVEVTVETRGSYPQLRGFVVQALQQDPAISLDALQLRRAGTDEPVVAGEFRFSTFMRAR